MMKNINVKVIYQHEDTKEIRKRVVEIGCGFPDLGCGWVIKDKCLMSELTDDNGKVMSRLDIVKVKQFIQKSINPDDFEEIEFTGLIDYADGHFFVRSKEGKHLMPLSFPDYDIEILGDNFTDSSLLS